MMYRNLLVLFMIIVSLIACNKSKESAGPSNPAAEGFDFANSDPAAVELADSIMVAMGGWRNWSNTRFITWDFNDIRRLTWDKKEERVRIDSNKDSITYIVDLKALTGKVWVKGNSLAAGDSLNKMLNRGKSIWINDSYWLVMPFKLKDTGVTLKYLGEDTFKTGGRCNVLELTFQNVGDTPNNKYQIYVDLADNLVKQWAYYSNVSQDSANFIRPWDNYKKYGKILLSADRSDSVGPKNVSVTATMDERIFTELGK